MANDTTTTKAAFLPKVWSKLAMLAFERKLFMSNRVMRFDADVRTKGASIQVPQVWNLTTKSVGTDGAYSGQANTETYYTITIDQWREASVSMPDIVTTQAAYPLLDIYTKKIGHALGQKVQQDLLALYSGLSKQVGTASVPLGDDTLLNAIQILDDADVPMEDRSFVARPSERRALLKLDKFVDASKTGLAKSPALTGVFGEFYGIPAWFSMDVTVSSGSHNVLFHKEAFGLALQISMKIEKFRLKLADDVVGHVLYGVSELRDDSYMGTAGVDVLT